MNNVDDGWISADDFDDEIPFLPGYKEKDEVDYEPREEEILGDCPVCGSHVVERSKAYSCSNRDCRFALWKDNRFFQSISKEMTKEIAVDLLNCGTVKLEGCESRKRKSGKIFDCYIDLGTDEEGRASFAIRFPERKSGGE